jgi:UDP-N-acetylglucosamine--N-acetylmuramyl-(pentapeptide) pyrophosphoryl-undecaprenol N-acetylglucosamine transferase
VLSRRRPSLVIGVGGYSSGPVVALAALRGVPTLLLEQNAMPGLANRLLARLVDAAAVTYDASLPWFHGHGVVTGNPVRDAFLSVPPRPAGGSDRTLLVFGGSQGARAINQAMVAAAPHIRDVPGALAIVHQTGPRDEDSVREGYRKAGVPAEVYAYLDDMPRHMADADLLVCRAGATTLAELTAAGRAAVLIPFPDATDDHQRKNAAALAEAGAAVVVDERELTAEGLAATIGGLLRDDARRAQVAARARTFARPDAAEQIAMRAFALMAGETA